MVAGIEPLSASRWSAPKSGSKLESGKLYLTNTGLLIEVAEERLRPGHRAGFGAWISGIQAAVLHFYEGTGWSVVLGYRLKPVVPGCCDTFEKCHIRALGWGFERLFCIHETH